MKKNGKISVAKAIESARRAAREYYKNEDVLEFSLEEVAPDRKGNWLITIGIAKPRPQPKKSGPREVGFLRSSYIRHHRQFAVDGDGEVLFMKRREI